MRVLQGGGHNAYGTQQQDASIGLAEKCLGQSSRRWREHLNGTVRGRQPVLLGLHFSDGAQAVLRVPSAARLLVVQSCHAGICEFPRHVEHLPWWL